MVFLVRRLCQFFLYFLCHSIRSQLFVSQSYLQPFARSAILFDLSTYTKHTVVLMVYFYGPFSRQCNTGGLQVDRDGTFQKENREKDIVKEKETKLDVSVWD